MIRIPQIQTLTTPNAGKRKLRSLLVLKQNGTATLGDSLAVSYRTKHALTIQSSNCMTWYLPQRVETVSTQKPAHGSL
jgi:hypothetical protein